MNGTIDPDRRNVDSARRRAVGILTLLLVTAMFLVPLPVHPSHPMLFALIGNAAHLPIMAAFTALLYFIGFGGRRLSRIALAGYGTAALVEIVQPLLGRTANPADLGLGCLGVSCTLAAVWVRRRGRSGALAWALGMAALAALLAALAPAWAEWQAIQLRQRLFPVLADFEDDAELRLWEILGGTSDAPSSFVRSESFAASGRSGLRVTQGAEGRGLYYAAGSTNWQSYRTLRFDIFNPGDAFELGLLVNDSHDLAPRAGYVRFFELNPGLNPFRLPLSEIRQGPPDRELDLSRVYRLALFPRPDEPSREYFLDNLRLE